MCFMFEFAKNIKEVSIIDKHPYRCDAFKVTVSKNKRNFFEHFTIKEVKKSTENKLEINEFMITSGEYYRLLSVGVIKIDFKSYGNDIGFVSNAGASNNHWLSSADYDFSLFLILGKFENKVIDVRRLICGETKYVESCISLNETILFLFFNENHNAFKKIKLNINQNKHDGSIMV